MPRRSRAFLARTCPEISAAAGAASARFRLRLSTCRGRRKDVGQDVAARPAVHRRGRGAARADAEAADGYCPPPHAGVNRADYMLHGGTEVVMPPRRRRRTRGRCTTTRSMSGKRRPGFTGDRRGPGTRAMAWPGRRPAQAIAGRMRQAEPWLILLEAAGFRGRSAVKPGPARASGWRSRGLIVRGRAAALDPPQVCGAAGGFGRVAPRIRPRTHRPRPAPPRLYAARTRANMAV